MPPTLFLALFLQATVGQNTIVEADPTAYIRGAVLGGLTALTGIAISALIGVLIKRYFDRRDKKADQSTQKQEEKEAAAKTLETRVLSIEKSLVTLNEEIAQVKRGAAEANQETRRQAAEVNEETKHIANEANRRSTFNEGRFVGFEKHLDSIQSLVRTALAQIREAP